MTHLTNSALNNQSGTTASTGGTTGPITSIGPSTNPADTINASIQGLQLDHSMKWTYPPDLPPVHFGMIETEWTNRYYTRPLDPKQLSIDPTKANLVGKKIFRFPVPTPLREVFPIEYNTGYAPGQYSLSTIQDPASAAFGIIPNTFRTVTLAQPGFRRHQFTWTLSPRTYQESVLVQQIIFALRKGMHPKRANSITGKAIFGFPFIYYPYFSPNPKFLFKFKPSVIENLDINFAGGQPVPAFYRQEGSPENKPPESVMMTLTFLELEYWLDSDADAGTTTDFKGGDLPTNDPFDGANYFRFANKTPAAAQQSTSPTTP